MTTESCTKAKFTSKAYADQFIDEVRRKSDRDTNPAKAYKCPKCGLWHITSQGKKLYTNNSVAIVKQQQEIDYLRNSLYNIAEKKKQNEEKIASKKTEILMAFQYANRVTISEVEQLINELIQLCKA